jgi:hypothetical protein
MSAAQAMGRVFLNAQGMALQAGQLLYEAADFDFDAGC